MLKIFIAIVVECVASSAAEGLSRDGIETFGYKFVNNIAE